MSEFITFEKLSDAAIIPSAPTHGDVGYDLRSIEHVVISPKTHHYVKTGLAVCPPPGFFTRIVGRSSTWSRLKCITIEGVIDAGYRGELMACLFNTSDCEVVIECGDRIAQLISTPACVHEIVEGKLPESKRGANGFGSTGVK